MNKKILSSIAVAAALFAGCELPRSGSATTGNDSTKVDSLPPAPAAVAPTYNSPESVISDGKFLYVANVGEKLEPSDKDGDGRIMKLDLAATQWIDKDKWAGIQLDAPKGMAIIGRRLFVADIDRIVEIDLDKAEKTAVYDFAALQTSFLNDLCVKDDSTLLFSATDINALYQLDLKTKEAKKLKTGPLNGPNGLFYAGAENKIYCVEYGSGEKLKGRVLVIDGNTGATRQLGKHVGGLDGVAMTAQGALLFSDWGTAHLEKMDIGTGAVTEIVSDSIRGPADFRYDALTGRAFVPAMMEGKLLVLEGIQ
jgi:sugar lactone lactonase YvrE